MSEKPKEHQLVDRFCHELGEHFDSVLILTSRPHPERPGQHTEGYSCINGSFHAAFGLAREWVITKEQILKTHADMLQRGDENEDNSM